MKDVMTWMQTGYSRELSGLRKIYEEDGGWELIAQVRRQLLDFDYTILLLQSVKHPWLIKTSVVSSSARKGKPRYSALYRSDEGTWIDLYSMLVKRNRKLQDQVKELKMAKSDLVPGIQLGLDLYSAVAKVMTQGKYVSRHLKSLQKADVDPKYLIEMDQFLEEHVHGSMRQQLRGRK